MKQIVAILCVVLAIFISSADAQSSSYTAAKKALSRATSDSKDFKRKVAKLSVADKAKLKTSMKGDDSDSDGIPDLVESAIGSNLCSGDSDSDGLDDSVDDHEDNPDSNKDGNPDGRDGQDSEAKGNVASYSGRVLVVAGKSFTVTDSTLFRGRQFSEAGLVAGVCVEVKGRVVSGANIADSIKRDDGC